MYFQMLYSVKVGLRTNFLEEEGGDVVNTSPRSANYRTIFYYFLNLFVHLLN